MRIAVPVELEGETRVAATPETVKVPMVKGGEGGTRLFRQRGLLERTEEAVRIAS